MRNYLIRFIFFSLLAPSVQLYAQTVSARVHPDQTVRLLNREVIGQGVWQTYQAYFWDFESQRLPDQAEQLFTALQPGMVGHYPGIGVLTHDFHWKNLIGPLGSRTDPTPQHRTFDTPLQTQFGPDEYGRMVEQLRELTGRAVEGSIQVNIVNGTAEEAADWVEYMNAPNNGSNPGGGTDWAAVRAQNGHPEPYNIRYWEFGNEPHYTAADIGSLDAWEYVERINEFAPLMKERDPGILLTGYVNPFNASHRSQIGTDLPDLPAGQGPSGTEPGLTWSQAVIRYAGHSLDLLHFHWFGAWNENQHDSQYTLTTMYTGLIPWLERLRKDVDQYAPDLQTRNRLRRVTIPEWNAYGGFTPPIATGTAMLGALANSRILHIFTQRPEIVMAQRLALAAPYPEPEVKALLPDLLDVREGYFSIFNRDNGTEYVTTAVYEMERLWARAYQPYIVQVEVDDAPTGTVGVPLLDVTALRSSLGGEMSLVVNNASGTSRSVSFTIEQYELQNTATIWQLRGNGLEDNNTYLEKQRVAIEEANLPLNGSPFSVEVPPHSITLILLEGSYPQSPLRRLE